MLQPICLSWQRLSVLKESLSCFMYRNEPLKLMNTTGNSISLQDIHAVNYLKPHHQSTAYAEVFMPTWCALQESLHRPGKAGAFILGIMVVPLGRGSNAKLIASLQLSADQPMHQNTAKHVFWQVIQALGPGTEVSFGMACCYNHNICTSMLQSACQSIQSAHR